MTIYYTHVLLAIDLSEESNQIAEKAKAIAERNQARLSIVYVQEVTPMMYGGAEFAIPLDSEYEREQLAQAKKNLTEYGARFGIAEHDQFLEQGPTKPRLLELIEKIGADLLVVGGHDRHGLALLLGSTTNALLHAMPCDILAVKIHES